MKWLVGLVVLFVVGLVGVAILGLWNMAIAQLLLQYLQVILSWPPMIVLVLLYLLFTQRTPLTRILEGFAAATAWKLSVRGVGVEVSKYPPGEDPEIADKVVKQIEVQKTTQETASSDFTHFLVRGIVINQSVISKLLDEVWQKQLTMERMFGVGKKPPERYLDKVDSVKEMLQDTAVKDLIYLETALRGDKKLETDDLINLFFKSQDLIGYLKDFVLRK